MVEHHRYMETFSSRATRSLYERGCYAFQQSTGTIMNVNKVICVVSKIWTREMFA
jgi:hypothetical protein